MPYANKQAMRHWFALLFAVTLTSCAASDAVAPAILKPAPLMVDLREGFRETLDLADTGNSDEAKRRLLYLLSKDETLADYYLYELGRVEARSGDSEAAISTLTKLYRKYPRSVQSPAAALQLGRLHLDGGHLGEAEAYLTLVRNTAWDKSDSLEAGLELGRLALAQDNPAQAATFLEEVRSESHGGPRAKRAAAVLQSIWETHPELAPSRAEWLDEARLLMQEHDYLAAERAIRTADPYQENPEALVLLAEALKGQGSPAAATTVLAKVVDQFPSHPLAPQALFRMATLFWNRDEDVPAEAAFLEFRRRVPNHRLAPDAMYALGRIEQSSGRIRAAEQTYGELARQYPRADVTWDARWRIGWIQYRNRRYREAAASFAALAREGGAANAPGAKYWQARSLEGLNRDAEALNLYQRIRREAPTSYYAWQAEKRLRMPSQLVGDISPAPIEVPAAPPDVDAYHLIRYDALRAAALPHLARGELAAIEREKPTDATRRFLVRAYLTVDGYRTAMRLAGQMSAGEISDDLRQRIRYPLAFWSLVSEESERNQVDPLLVTALIRQESLFDPEARSPANARGLMQLLPSTARHEAQELGWSTDPVGQLEDPAVNLVLGVRHFREQLDYWQGDLIKALAAYNGGVIAVQKWQKLYGNLERDEFVESITYRETRDYVKRVLGHYRAYAKLYGDNTGVAASN